MNDISAPRAEAGPDLDSFLGAPPAKPFYRRPKVIAAGVVLLILLLILARMMGGSAAPAFASETVRRQNVTVTVSATGNLQPTNKVEVGSEQSGLVDQVYVDNNDRVAKGQPLARLDPSRLRDTLVQAQAAHAAALAQLAQFRASAVQADANLARLEEVYRLSGGKVPSRTELDTGRAEAQRARAGVRAGEAQVTQARAQVSSAQTNLSKATIYSPVTGVVLSRDIDPGQTVAASFQAPVLFTIAEDLSQMELEVKVDEADVGQVREGQQATFTVDAYPGRRFQAQIERVDLGANASSGSTTSTTSTNTVIAYTAVLRVANPDLLLRPGMTATADIVTSERKNVLVVPNAALRFRPTGAAARSGVTSILMPPRGPRGAGGRNRQATIGRGSRQTVYVIAADGQLQPREVIVGESNGSVTEIVGGTLRPGEKVATGQLSADGQPSGGRPSGGGPRG